MRRGIGIVLAFVGILLLAGAAILRWVIAPNAIKVPLEEDGEPYTVTSVATGTGTVLNQTTGQSQSGLALRSERVITTDVEASTDDIAVWDVEVSTQIELTGTEISSTTDRVAFDRETSEAVSGFDEAVDGDRDASHEGTISYKFPFDTQQETYSYFDTTTQRGWDAEFQGTEEVAGLETYHFTQVVEPTVIGEVEVPGALLRQPVPSVTLDRVYNTTRQFYVEPETGTIIRGSEETQQVLRFEAAGVEIPAINAELEFDEETVAARADDASDAKDRIGQVRDTWPLIAAIGGAGLLLLGVLLARRGRTPADGEGAPVEGAGTAAAGAAAAGGAATAVTTEEAPLLTEEPPPLPEEAAAVTEELPDLSDEASAVTEELPTTPDEVSAAVDEVTPPSAEPPIGEPPSSPDESTNQPPR